MSKFRKGDIVAVKFIVEGALDGCDLRLRQPESYSEVYVKRKDVTLVQPQIEVGDTVRCFQQGPRPGVVLAVANEHAWVDLGEGCYATWWLSNVERVDPEPAKSDEDEKAPPPEVDPSVKRLVPRIDDDDPPPTAPTIVHRHTNINVAEESA